MSKSRSPSNKQPYAKPWLSTADQLALLEQRGLAVDDREAAEAFLSHVNYYRFSGYCLAFEDTRHQYPQGVTFEKVRDAYEFDRDLRDLVTEALEVVEVDLRAAIAYHLGQQHGAFGYLDAKNFFHRFDHPTWLAKLRIEADRSSELFVTHFRSRYAEYPDLPTWIVTEIMSFGGLSHMLRGMHKRDQKPIAARYGVQPQTLVKIVHHCVYVRNVCAHHSRLWDRQWAIKPELPRGADWQRPLLPGNDRLFATVLLLYRFMQRAPSVAPFDTDWKDRLFARIDEAPAVYDPLKIMGLTPNWKQHPVWG
ncbi:Abi family protein [Adhaeretor mobilis]|uniref:Abi-like protein n=1 Tax=Adhaeretor mobilis TaxID=1930276 RepID=A0A517MQ79_9BACT|nr:Abi family protein [Adhaeretor mobilis]QDS97043.1 Abi-like protein [Adhaeretor mobilis]